MASYILNIPPASGRPCRGLASAADTRCGHRDIRDSCRESWAMTRGSYGPHSTMRALGNCQPRTAPRGAMEGKWKYVRGPKAAAYASRHEPMAWAPALTTADPWGAACLHFVRWSIVQEVEQVRRPTEGFPGPPASARGDQSMKIFTREMSSGWIWEWARCGQSPAARPRQFAWLAKLPCLRPRSQRHTAPRACAKGAIDVGWT